MVKRVTRKAPLVVYWNNIPSPYMVERFNTLAERDSVRFEAWFNDRSDASRSWDVAESEWRFNYRYIAATRIGKWRFHWPWIIFFTRPTLLICLYAKPSFLFGWIVAKCRGIATAFWVEVTFDSWVDRKRVYERIKRWIFPRATAIVTVGNDGKQFAERYGAQAARIHYAPHRIDVIHYAEGAAQARGMRDTHRHALALTGITFIYVGRLWWGKGLSVLVDAFEQAQSELGDPISLLIVGDGPEEQELKRACERRRICNVAFVSFQQKPDIPKYYALADVFIFPTLGDPYGLVVDEAMACGLPIVSSSAAGEIEDRIEHGVNGFIVPPQDSSNLAKYMILLARSPKLRKEMGARSYARIKGSTPEKWADDIERIVGHVTQGTKHE